MMAAAEAGVSKLVLDQPGNRSATPEASIVAVLVIPDMLEHDRATIRPNIRPTRRGRHEVDSDDMEMPVAIRHIVRAIIIPAPGMEDDESSADVMTTCDLKGKDPGHVWAPIMHPKALLRGH
jgi:hypothetical protein